MIFEKKCIVLYNMMIKCLFINEIIIVDLCFFFKRYKISFEYVLRNIFYFKYNGFI